MIFLLVEIGGLRVVIAPRGEDIVALPHAGTAVDLRMKKIGVFNSVTVLKYLIFPTNKRSSMMEALFDKTILTPVIVTE